MFYLGVLGNLTSLKVLDLSFNNLGTMNKVGHLPENMTTLLMSDNKLTRISKEIINFIPKLTDFNVENNRFNNFPPELAKIVSKGPTISFKGMYTPPVVIHVYSKSNFIEYNSGCTRIAFIILKIDTRIGSHPISKDFRKKRNAIHTNWNIRVYSTVFIGNPIECDCALIPIKRMLNSKLNPDPQWTNITCVQLLTSEVAYVSDLSENELICDIPIKDDDDFFTLTPDVKFRDMKK